MIDIKKIDKNMTEYSYIYSVIQDQVRLLGKAAKFDYMDEKGLKNYIDCRDCVDAVTLEGLKHLVEVLDGDTIRYINLSYKVSTRGYADTCATMYISFEGRRAPIYVHAYVTGEIKMRDY